jgi:hemoglobin-like flavoprotein
VTHEQAVAIRTSWALTAPSRRVLAERFYLHLFELDPALRALFAATDFAALERKLTAALAEVVRLLDEPQRFVAVIVPLGRRHAAYGVRERDYTTASVALRLAFTDVLDTAFTGEMDQAWRELHALVSAVMVRAGAAGDEAFGGATGRP